MSLGHMLAAWDLLPGKLTPQERVVLVALAEDCRAGRDVASPGHDILSARSGLKRSQLSATLARLAAHGLIALAETARRGRRAVYRLLFAERPAGRTQTGPNGTDHDAGSVRESGPLPGTTPPRKNFPARARAAAASKIRKNYGPQTLPAAVLPDNKLTFGPRTPARAGLDTPPPAWAVQRATEQLGRFARPGMVVAVARGIAATATERGHEGA